VTVYVPHTWADLPAKITALDKETLDEIEAGIATRVGSVDGINPDSAGNVALPRNTANGYAPLDSNANVPTANLYSASATQTGVVRLTGDLGGTSTAPTVPTKAPVARIVGSGTALAGGGDLSADRVISAVIGTTAGTLAEGNHDHGVTAAPVVQAYASSLTPNAAAGNYRIVTATGNFTLQEPSSGVDGQMWRLRVIASGAQRIVTFATALYRPSHIGTTLTIPSGRRGDIGMLYETGDGWTVLAAQAA
jgi:hypothetical protein